MTSAATDSRPLVKVVVTSYNRPSWLRAAVDSVLAQTYSELHVVIVDDCSEIEAREVALAYAIDQPHRFTVVAKPENRGVADSVAVGLRAGPDAEYVALLNDDDLWYPSKIEAQLRMFAENPNLSLVHSEADVIDGNGDKTGDPFSSLFGRFSAGDLREVIRGNHACASTLMTTREVAAEVAASLPRRSLVWDYFLVLVAANHGAVGRSEAVLAAYRDSGTGVHTHENQMWRDTSSARHHWLMCMDEPTRTRVRQAVASANVDVAARQLNAHNWREYAWHAAMVARERDAKAIRSLVFYTARHLLRLQ